MANRGDLEEKYRTRPFHLILCYRDIFALTFIYRELI